MGFIYRGNFKKKKKKLYGPFLWMGFNCLKATEPLRGGTLLFTFKLPSVLFAQFKKREKHSWRSVTLGKDAGF